ncbi:hypothetical protein ABFU02_07305 [Xanthomonas campestris pv. raphani]|uniref:hypothetical protein n=1 Tax=Xanthomonas campestris TaxID=339 RepID=UPI0038904CBE
MLWSFISSPEQRNPEAMMVLLRAMDRLRGVRRCGAAQALPVRSLYQRPARYTRGNGHCARDALVFHQLA